MNARQIEVFRAVMRSGTLTAAAKLLNVSQPALSQLLRHTEDQLGFRLFSRTAGRLVPTPEAVRLYPAADRLHQDLDGLRRLALDLRDGKTGSLRLATSAPPALSFVPAAVQAFRAECPGLRLITHVVPMAVLTTMLERSEVEIGVGMNDTPHPLLRTERIGQTRMMCLLPEGHRLAANGSVSPGDLQAESLISYHLDTLPGTRLSQAFAAAGVAYSPQIEIDVSIGAISFVQGGFGVALVDGLLPWSGFPGLVTRPFTPHLVLPVCLVSNARRPLLPVQEVLASKLRDAAIRYQGHAE